MWKTQEFFSKTPEFHRFVRGVFHIFHRKRCGKLEILIFLKTLLTFGKNAVFAL